MNLWVMPWLEGVSKCHAGSSSGSRGLGHFPIIGGAAAPVPSRWAPTIGGALILSLPTGNSACGLGSGQTTVGVDAGVGVAATASLRLSADASRNLSGLAGQTSFTPSQATSLRLEVAADVAPRW